MTNEKKRTCEEREIRMQKAIRDIVRELKGGATITALKASGRFTNRQIDRGFQAFERSSFKGKKSDRSFKCPCGAMVKKLNILGECFACQTRKAMRVS